MEFIYFALGVAVTMVVWRLSVPTLPIDRIRLALRKIIIQGPTHDKEISKVYSLIREVAEEEFSEDNAITLDDCLREWFERTQFEGLYQEGRAILAENARLRAAIAPILYHADAPETAPPLGISVRMAREMKEKVNGYV